MNQKQINEILVNVLNNVTRPDKNVIRQNYLDPMIDRVIELTIIETEKIIMENIGNGRTIYYHFAYRRWSRVHTSYNI